MPNFGSYSVLFGIKLLSILMIEYTRDGTNALGVCNIPVHGLISEYK